MNDVKLFKKNDLLIVFILVLISAAGFFVFRFFSSGTGSKVRITVEGQVFREAELNIPEIIEIPGKTGVCRLEIKDGAADMIYAYCPNQICVHHEAISSKGEAIVCLPNKVVVEVID